MMAAGLVAAMAALAMAMPGPGPKTLLAPAGFSAGLAGWQQVGQALFSADPAQAHDGLAAARITVQAGVKPQYQQLRFETSEDLLPADLIRASAWVRTEGVTADPGPYLALEFVNATGERVGIASSRMGRGIGSREWEQLTVEGSAPAGVKAVRLNMILHANGAAWFAGPGIVRADRPEPWPDLGNTRRAIRVGTGKPLQPDFGGVGFHAFQATFAADPREMDEVIYKRWRELRPSFVRVNHEIKWDHARLDRMAEHLKRMEETGASIYITTWDPEVCHGDQELAAYARKVADHLEYLVRDKGIRNIRWYCMTNELSLGGWGLLASDLPTFQAYHTALAREFAARGLKIGLLATDASPVSFWGTLDWAATHMDGITAIYGGHHYINEHPLEDERFYNWFLERTREAVKTARDMGKRFILGEFGSKQDSRVLKGINQDRCVWFETPKEAMAGLQVAEAAIAAVNAGVYAMGYWTFMDLPDDFAPGYINKWGLFRCSGTDRSTRDIYYGYGLLTRWFRAGCDVMPVECADPRLRVAAVRYRANGAWSIAVINRNRQKVPLSITLGSGPAPAMRRYVYDTSEVVGNPFGDMPGPDSTVKPVGGALRDSVPAMSLVVYSSDPDHTPPPPVTGVKATVADQGVPVTWNPSPAPDLCYYRVFRGGKQIGSTTACRFYDPAGTPLARYRVVAVDRVGNAAE